MNTTAERFLRYAKMHTTSKEDTGLCPSSDEQFALAKLLVRELIDMGIQNAEVDEHCYVYASLPASEGLAHLPALGFVAHMDTAPAFSGLDVQPIVHENYNGGDIILPKNGRVISAAQFPFLQTLKGKSVITADGSTLLGADDKAGIAEILSLCEAIIQNNIPHCKLCIGFTPDEEVGAGADLFDVKRFGAAFAYTMDGDAVGGIEYENFNAASVRVHIKGVSVHPGSAKDIMVNALSLAAELHAMLPAEQTPQHTEGYEGFYHLESLCGTAAEAEMEYILRDHSRALFEEKKDTLACMVEMLQHKYPTASIRMDTEDSYFNMKEQIAPHMHLVENAKRAAEAVGVTPVVKPIRGGTDGARLSYMGLPCPNLGTGGANFHGPYELIAAEDMAKAVQMLQNLVALYSKV